MGFEDLENYRAYSRKRIVEYADARLRTRDVKTLEKWEEVIT